MSRSYERQWLAERSFAERLIREAGPAHKLDEGLAGMWGFMPDWHQRILGLLSDLYIQRKYEEEHIFVQRGEEILARLGPSPWPRKRRDAALASRDLS